FLPTLRGFGEIPDLHVAMSKNDQLRARVIAFVSQATPNDLFSHPARTQQSIEEILFQWADVTAVPSDSRGPHIDGRKLAFLEKFFGNKFVQTGAGGRTDPLPQAAALINESWRRLYHA